VTQNRELKPSIAAGSERIFYHDRGSEADAKGTNNTIVALHFGHTKARLCFIVNLRNELKINVFYNLVKRLPLAFNIESRIMLQKFQRNFPIYFGH